jgi:hypothetical protein
MKPAVSDTFITNCGMCVNPFMARFPTSGAADESANVMATEIPVSVGKTKEAGDSLLHSLSLCNVVVVYHNDLF